MHYLRDAARIFALAASFALAAIITPDIVQAASATAPPDVSSPDTAPAASTPATPISTISKPAAAPASTNEGAGPSAASPPSEPAYAAKAAPSTDAESDSTGNPASASGQGSSPFAAFDAAPSHGPIDINSDSLFLDYKKNQVFYRGHVHAKRPFLPFVAQLQLAGSDDIRPVPLPPEERDAIAASKGAAARGEFASDEQVRAVWTKHGL